MRALPPAVDAETEIGLAWEHTAWKNSYTWTTRLPHGPNPGSVYDHMVKFYRECGVNPGRSGFDKAIEAGNILEDLRKRLTAFFGGDDDTPERLCFGYNATDALNLICQGLLGAGDHVITTNLEHNSVSYTHLTLPTN